MNESRSIEAQPAPDRHGGLLQAASSLVMLAGLYLTSRVNYLLFHSLAELFTVVVAFSVFVIAWSSRRYIQNSYLLCVGVAYGALGFLDLLHTLAYQGMQVLPDPPFAANQLWIAARALESATLLVAFLALAGGRRPSPVALISVYAAITALLVASIFWWRVFPVCFVAGQGQTPFKINAEYAIIAGLVGALVLLYRDREQFEPTVYRALAGSIVAAIACEFAFTRYVSNYGLANLIGHCLKVVSYFLVHKAVIETGVRQPYELIFRELSKANVRLDGSEKSQHRLAEDLQLILDNLPALVYRKDAENRFLQVNQPLAEAHHLTTEQMKGRNLYDLYPLEDAKKYHLDDLEVIRSGQPRLHLEEGWQTGEEQRWLSTSKIPVRDERGEISGIVGISVEITARKVAEEQLKKSQAQLRAIFESSTDCILVWNRQQTFLYANRAALKRLKLPAAGVIGLGLREGLGHLPEVVELWSKRVEQVFASREALRAEDAVTIGDRVVYSESVFSPIVDERGDLFAVGVIDRDVTERRLLTIELKRSNEELEQFAYVASHDLQEPLRMVALYTQLLAERYQGRLDEKADGYIHYIVGGAQRMRELINDLLAFSRVTTQGKEFLRVDCGALLGQVLSDLGVAIQESRAQVTSGPLPVVLADRSQLGQVLQNLIANAVKFRDVEPPALSIAAARSGSEWTFSVSDNGIGISPEHRERIFHMFQRLHDRNRYPGNGIGLAVTRRIIERHGGRIWVEPNAPRGSTFRFTLPVADASLPSAPKSPPGR